MKKERDLCFKWKAVSVFILIALLFSISSVFAYEKEVQKFNGIGVFTSKTHRGYRVDAIVKDSPAFQKLKVGDIIESINGLFTHQRKPGEIYKLLRKKPGTKVVLIVQQKNRKSTINLITKEITLSGDNYIGKFPDNTAGNDVEKKLGRILSFEKARRVFSKDFTDKDKYNSGDIFKVTINGKEVGKLKVSQTYDYGTYFTQIEGNTLNQVDRNKYKLEFSEKAKIAQKPVDKRPGTEDFKSPRKCYHCNTPVRRGIKVDGMIHCNKCARRLCDVCWCCSDWKLKTDGQKLYTNMFVCNECLDKVWESDSLTNSLYNKVQFMMEREWGVQLTASPNISMEKMRSLTLGYYTPLRDRIKINKKLKFLGIMGTIAHEHAHAWQQRKNPKITNMVVIEGFASWVEYNFYKMVGEEELGRVLLELKPDYYRQGFAVMQKVEREYGFKGVFKAIERYRED